MPARNTGTEDLIKETAKKVFLEQGRLHATTEEIAKAAGVPRTSVHYYFRTKEILFKHVFNDALIDLTERLNGALESNLTFRDKIENFVDICLTQGSKYPHLETFIITEIISQQFELVDKATPTRFKAFVKEIRVEMDNGVIPKMNPLHFILNMFSLLSYPSIASPLCKKLFGTDDKAYQKLLRERKQVIMQLLLGDSK